MEQYGRKTEQLASVLEQIEDLRALAEKSTTVLSQVPGGSGMNDSRIEALVVKISELEEQLGRLWKERDKKYIDILNVIKELPDNRCRKVLEKRYLELMMFDSIADALGRTTRYIYTLHDIGLKDAEKILQKNSSQTSV